MPGFTEIDLVAHSGDCADGEFVHSLNQTDIHTTWVETRAVLGRGQAGVQQALAEMREALPFPLRELVQRRDVTREVHSIDRADTEEMV